MAKIYPTVFFNNKLMPAGEAGLNIASSAVLYGLSVYTVFPVCVTKDEELVAFRLKDHFKRLLDSARIIGIDTFEQEWDFARFEKTVKELIAAQPIGDDVFVRATVHVDELVPGTRSRGLHTNLSIFIYEALPIVPQDGARLKTSVWRRVPDYAIPSRAKVNGAYVNSVLAKQDAIDSGYDDCIFLDTEGHVCELSAANIFIVRNGSIITPDTTSDLLEGINRRTIIEIAEDLKMPLVERQIDLTELYIADEVFTSGTSAFIAPVIEIDARKIGDGKMGPITKKLRTLHLAMLRGDAEEYQSYMTAVGSSSNQ
jgi:branched-chain amino acid aminotransferase